MVACCFHKELTMLSALKRLVFVLLLAATASGRIHAAIRIPHIGAENIAA